MFGLFNKKVCREYGPDDAEWYGSEEYYQSNDEMQKRQDAHRENWGDNSTINLNIPQTLAELTEMHLAEFRKTGNAKLPPQYEKYFDAPSDPYYRRYADMGFSDSDAVKGYLNLRPCRQMMIEDDKYTNNHYALKKDPQFGFVTARELSLQGLDILAQCEAYEIYLKEREKLKNNSINWGVRQFFLSKSRF